MTHDEYTQQPDLRYRLAWKFHKSGTTGSGPWMSNRDTVEAWVESLTRRYHDAVEHWVEAEPVERRRAT